MIGAALGGAVKNVIAIAAGICAGQGLGDNARAGLITRGLAEQHVWLASWVQKVTPYPAWLGWESGFILFWATLRNMAFGFALGSGKPVPTSLAEGRFSASILKARSNMSPLNCQYVLR